MTPRPKHRSSLSVLAAAVALSMIAFAADAADIACGGHITLTMADHPACSGNLAFKTEGAGDVWMCTKSSGAGALLLAAMLSDKLVGVWIEGGDVAGCTSLPMYRQISYVIIYP